ncbi:hypothetical protein [Mesoplasma photuris]|uniref:hypothetical protein n=1 Tax=Mesoplasma photuris TaxID=217731 RepID=UPI0004E217FD|nr:hypothetical protein [Mesoplasma photuris]
MDSLINQIIKIFKIVKNENNDEETIFKIVEHLKNIIDDKILVDKSIIYNLNNRLKESNKNIEFNIDRNFKVYTNEQVDSFLNTLKALMTILLVKENINNLYIYSEIKSILNFYINQSSKEKLYDAVDSKFSMNNIEYHKQNQMFKGLFAIFDKFTFINHFIVEKFNLIKVKEESAYRFTDDFGKLSKPFLFNKSAEARMEDFLLNFKKSSAFHYVRKLRNNMEHSFTNPDFEINYSNEIKLVYILICRVILEIFTDFQSDDQIKKIIQQRN